MVAVSRQLCPGPMTSTRFSAMSLHCPHLGSQAKLPCALGARRGRDTLGLSVVNSNGKFEFVLFPLWIFSFPKLIVDLSKSFGIDHHYEHGKLLVHRVAGTPVLKVGAVTS